jgi:hypothetical protein
MADSWLVAIVVHRCRKSPNSRLEWQTRMVFSDWRTKGAAFWDERLEK